MKTPEIPHNEIERQIKLESYEILDTEDEIDYDAITQIAARILNVPYCVISMVDKDRQWFKSKYGIEAAETPRDISFCGHTINENDVFVVENALEDVRFFDNPLVTGELSIRFYAGAQLKTPDGFNLGTICAIDNKERTISEEDKKLLKVFANNIITLFELKKQNKILQESLNDIKTRNDVLSSQLTDKENAFIKISDNQYEIISKELTQITTENISIIKKVNFIKNAVANTFLEKNNKLIFMADSDETIKINEVEVDLIFKYLFLTINDLYMNDIFIVKPLKKGLKYYLLIKNTFWILWKSKNTYSDIQLKEQLEKNENYVKLLQISKNSIIKIDFIYNSSEALEVSLCLN